MERYLVTDPRIEPTTCHHTQIRDIHVGHSAWCLDCGAVVDITRNWMVLHNEPTLRDSELVARRIDFNNFFFDQVYKIQPTDPDDPDREKEVEQQLRRAGITRLK